MEKPAKQTFQKAFQIFTFLMVLYHILSTRFLFFNVDQHKNIHLTFCLLLVFVSLVMREDIPKWRRMLYALCAVLSLAIGVFIHVDYFQMVVRLVPSQLDTMLGCALIVLVLEATRVKYGLVIPCLVLLVLLYGYFGNYLSGIFYHGGLSFPRLISYSSTSFRGLFGSMTSLSATTIFPFIMFAVLIEQGGGRDMLYKIANRLGGAVRSGPAQAAVVSSALMGMISGSTAANVASTGSFTIPLMKRHGYAPEFAGAVECVASTGGQFLPPIMGVSAFLIVGITGIPYYQVAIASLAPAVIYYLVLGFACQLRALRSDLKTDRSLSSREKTHFFRSYYQLLLPIIVLCYFLVRQYSAGFSVFYAIVTLVVLQALQIIIRHRGDLKPAFQEIGRFIWESCQQGAQTIAPLCAIVAALGIIVEMATATGFGQKLAFAMIELSGGSLFLLLLLSAAAAIIFGMGMPTPGAYMLVALLGAPAMIDFGIDILTAHLFVFYYAALSALTPPVAIAPLVACGISGGKFLPTAGNAVRLGFGAFILPFYFVYRSALLRPGENFPLFLATCFVILLGLVCLNVASERYFFTRLSWLEAAAYAAAAVLMFDTGMLTTLLGLALFAALTALQVIRYRKQRKDRAAVPAAEQANCV